MATKSNSASPQLIQQLNKILSLEYAAVVQYLQHSFLVSGHERIVFSDFFHDQSEESHKHAKTIGDKIVALGGVPTVEPATIHQSTDLHEMLQQDLTLEREAMEAYLKAHELAKDMPGLKFLLESIIQEEQEHIDELEKTANQSKVAVADKEIKLQRAV